MSNWSCHTPLLQNLLHAIYTVYIGHLYGEKGGYVIADVIIMWWCSCACIGTTEENGDTADDGGTKPTPNRYTSINNGKYKCMSKSVYVCCMN